MRTNLSRLRFSLGILALHFGLVLTADSRAGELKTIAKVNGIAITSDRFDSALTQALTTGRSDSPQLRKELRDYLIAEELIWQKAAGAGASSVSSPNSQERLVKVAAYLRGKGEIAPIGEAAVAARYREIVSSLGPKEFRFSLIQTKERDTLLRARSEIERGQDFSFVARKHSKAPSAQRGGELDWTSFPLPLRPGHTNGVPLPIAQALVSLKPGELSAPLDLQDSWALVRLDAMRPTLIPDYAQVSSNLRKGMQFEALQRASKTMVVELMRGAKIEVSE